MQSQLQPSSSPSVTGSDWRVWWQLTRPHTLTAAFAPVLLGTALAIETSGIHWGLFLAMLIASLLIQAATNMFNEYYDYVRGLDNENSIGIGGAIVRHGIKPKTVLFPVEVTLCDVLTIFQSTGVTPSTIERLLGKS